MEQRIEKVELQIEHLISNQHATAQFHASVDASVKQIASSFEAFKEFQIKTEMHRQNDSAHNTAVLARLDKEEAQRSADLNKIYKLIRNEQDFRQKRDLESALTEVKVETLETAVDCLEMINETKSKNFKKTFFGMLIAIVGSITPWLFTK
jgi:hypothetical protein